MRIEQSYYGDYIVSDEMPFSANDIVNAAVDIELDDGVMVRDWPVTMEYSNKIGRWFLWFLRPVADKEYEKVSKMPAGLRAND
jgi:hypothetical protein